MCVVRKLKTRLVQFQQMKAKDCFVHGYEYIVLSRCIYCISINLGFVNRCYYNQFFFTYQNCEVSLGPIQDLTKRKEA